MPALLNCLLAAFARANADCLVQIADENLSIADLSGARRLGNGFDHARDIRFRDCQFELILGTKSTVYSVPRYISVCPFWRPKPRTSVTVMPLTPLCIKASLTSSNLKCE